MAKTKEIFNNLSLVARLNEHIEELTADEDSARALLAKESSFKVLAELASLQNPDPREDAQFEHQRADFKAHDAAFELPFHLQGDQAFNEASAVARRRQLRHSDAIKSKIQFLWQVARGHENAERIRTRSRPTPTGVFVDEQGYSEMMLLIFKVLRDDFVLETALKQIQCDWEVDSHHGDALSYEQFFAALFELVDVWTCDIVEATYVRFLELLTRRITVRVVVFLDDRQLTLALSDNFDDAVVVKAIPLSTIKKFASVARVMEGTGVRTVGELASADPRAVETQRVGYLKRNTFSQDKIGADLQSLLSMFRELSRQFQDADYALHDAVLRRVSDSRQRGEQPSSRGGDRSSSFPLVNPSDIQRRRLFPVDTTRCGEVNRSSSFPETDRGAGGLRGHDERRSLDWAMPGGLGSAWQSGVASSRASSSSAGQFGASEAAMIDGSSSSSGSQAERTGRREIKRIDTLHDLSLTETSVIDTLKTTFLIEKGISVQRKTDAADVRAELAKFGVDAAGMTDDEMADKYQSLYEMFVLRDGDNIKQLALSVLARIKVELAAHGVVVSDDEMEAMYDGFYGSVVRGSGERIVADAKSWVDDTVSSGVYDSYIKHDYHALRSIDEVKQLGSEPGDDEFASLLSTGEDENNEEGDDDGRDGDAGADRSGAGTGSPNGRVTGTLSKRPSLYRIPSHSPKKDTEADVKGLSQWTLGAAGGLVTAGESSIREGGERCPGASAADVSTASLVDEDMRAPGADVKAVGDAESDKRQGASQSDDAVEGDRSSAADDGVEETDADGHAESLEPVDEASTRAGGGVEMGVEGTIGSSVDVPIGESDEDEEARRRKSLGSVRGQRGGDGDVESEALDGSHVHDKETVREAQGVDFEYEEPVQHVGPEPSPAAPEVPAMMEPKVPDIVVGGVDSAKHVAVAARYIQLLGLGNVTTIPDEGELQAYLRRPPNGASVDLLCFDVGDQLEDALPKARELVKLLGRGVILFGGDEQQPDSTASVATACVADTGVWYFATTPIDFPALRNEIQAFFENSPHPFILRHRRPTSLFGAAVKRLSTAMRAADIISVEDDHPWTVSTPDAGGARHVKRKATATPSAAAPVSLPAVPAARRETFSPFRPLRILDEMAGADIGISTPMTPVVPSAQVPKAYKKSPRLSAALKRIMR